MCSGVSVVGFSTLQKLELSTSQDLKAHVKKIKPRQYKTPFSASKVSNGQIRGLADGSRHKIQETLRMVEEIVRFGFGWCLVARIIIILY